MTTAAATKSPAVFVTCGRCGGSGFYAIGTCFGCAGATGFWTTQAKIDADAKRARAAEAKRAARLWAGEENLTVADYIARNAASVAAGNSFAGSPESTLKWATDICARKDAYFASVKA